MQTFVSWSSLWARTFMEDRRREIVEQSEAIQLRKLIGNVSEAEFEEEDTMQLPLDCNGMAENLKSRYNAKLLL